MPVAVKEKLDPYLSGLTMGKFAKAVIEIDPEFFADKPHLRNMHIDLLDGEPSAFCHVNSNGQNTLALLVGGDAAAKLEKMSPDDALKLIHDKLAPAQELEGYESHIMGQPFLTNWMENPLTLGSYSARKMGGERKIGIQEGSLLFAGEAFHPTVSGTLAGAYLSGQHAALEVEKQLAAEKSEKLGRKR
jgi:monoamine oxidase